MVGSGFALMLAQGWAIILPQGPNEKPTLLPRANQHFVTRYQKDKTRCHSTNSRCRLVNFKHHVCELGQWSTHAHVISSQYISISVFEWVFIHYLVINWPHKWNIADLLRATQNHQEGRIRPPGLRLPTPDLWGRKIYFTVLDHKDHQKCILGGNQGPSRNQ